MEVVEERLRGLLLQGLDADAAAYQRFLKELSAHLRAFLRLKVGPAQEQFVAPNAVSIAQAYFYRDTAWFRGICDGDKYFWVQAESFAAAALLAVRTGEEGYWSWYDRIWDYSWRHMIDHRYGAWFRKEAP